EAAGGAAAGEEAGGEEEAGAGRRGAVRAADEGVPGAGVVGSAVCGKVEGDAMIAGRLGSALLMMVLLAGLCAGQTPKPIDREGLMEAVKLGGLGPQEIVGIIKDFGVDFRLSAEDFEDPHELAKYAATAGISLEEFRKQFQYLVDIERANGAELPLPLPTEKNGEAVLTTMAQE
ncbi:hypothetical protein DWB58_27330, partial [candidate division KSB1 bacterium]|nr:hypothetical protein [candidate division KSB1 bacterium]